MIRLDTAPSRFDPVDNLGTAILRQAMFDLEKYSPATIAKMRAKVDEPGISSELRSMRRWRWGEASDMREELIQWIGSPDFVTVVGWSGFDVGNVKKSFEAVLESHKEGAEPKKTRRKA